MKDRLAKKQEFIKVLAKQLTKDLAVKSIKLEMGEQSAKDWAELWQASTLFGYPTTEEAEKVLMELLG